MAKPLRREIRDRIISMLAEGHDRDTIAAMVGVTPGQVSAVAAHVTIGTYRQTARVPRPARSSDSPSTESLFAGSVSGRSSEAATGVPERVHSDHSSSSCRAAIVVGNDVSSGELVTWDPHPDSGLANPHVLIVGESEFGKTYATACLLTELAQQSIPSVVLDYAQGFGLANASPWFLKYARPIEIQAGKDGIAINPLQLFPEDVHGPANVAQRVADTFARVYPKIGVQQHAVLRQAALEVLSEAGLGRGVSGGIGPILPSERANAAIGSRGPTGNFNLANAPSAFQV